MLDQKIMETVNRYICSAHGLILLLDPLQIDSVRNRLPKGTPVPAIWGEVTEIINRTTNIIRKRNWMRDNQKIKAPIAVAFTKFDALDPILPNGLQLKYHPDRGEGYDVEDHIAVSEEVQSLLDGWGCRHIVHQIKVHFQATAFFGLSALGCNPHKDSHIPEVKPRRVEDPFLWLLYYYGLIKHQAAKE
jgi:hypothetical protein